MSNFLARKKCHHFYKIYILYHTYYLCICLQRIFTTLDKGLRKNIKKRREGKIGQHKLNEMGALNMKYKKWNKLDKSKRLSYSPGVFKHDCSLQSHLELWEKKAISGHLYFSKTYRIILICIWILKINYRFFY